MKTHLLIALFTVAILCLSLGAQAAPASDWVYPAIQGYGPVHPLPKAALQPSKYRTYKVVFNLTRGADADKVNDGLAHVARAVNVFASAGVPLKQLKFVVVVHGPATALVLRDASYKTRYKTGNPNLDLIGKLTAAGVKLVVCGQALADNGISHDEVNPQVEITLSALSDLILLQDQGYKLMPL